MAFQSETDSKNNTFNQFDQNQKPLIIINCSKEKENFSCRPIDMYCGQRSISTIIRGKSNILYENYKYDLHAGAKNYTLPKIEDIADIYILSAKLGLINAFGDVITPYNLELTEKNIEEEGFVKVDDFIKSHKKATRTTLRSLNISNREVYVCMTGKYLGAFRKMTDSLLKDVSNLYVSEEIMGFGDLRGKVAKVCKTIARKFAEESPHFRVNHKPPVVFRSGITTAQEMDIYDHNNENIGSSLHYINTSKPIHHLNHVIKKLSKGRSNRVFLDNGFISNPNLEPSSVFSEYNKIIDLISVGYLGNLSIVIPDNLDAESALELVTKHKEDILRLSKQWVRVILPIHALDTVKAMRKHVTSMLEALDWPENITAGIPSLRGREYSLGKVQGILSIKNPNGELAFSGVHFLGHGDSKGVRKRFQRRVMLAEVVGITDISFDSNRANALWGNVEENKLQGTKIINRFEQELKEPPLTRTLSSACITQKYDSRIVSDFYVNGLTLQNLAPALKVLNDRFPIISNLYCDSPEETLSKAKANLRSVNQTTWELTSQRLLTDLIDFNLLSYDANSEFGYYDKRKISYGILKSAS